MIDPVRCEQCGAEMEPVFYQVGGMRCNAWHCQCGWTCPAIGRERMITRAHWDKRPRKNV